MYHLPQLQYIREHWGFLCFNNNNNKNIKIMCYWVNLNNNWLNYHLFLNIWFSFFPSSFNGCVLKLEQRWEKVWANYTLALCKDSSGPPARENGQQLACLLCYTLGYQSEEQKTGAHTTAARAKTELSPGHCVCLTNLFPVRENHQNINKMSKYLGTDLV